MNSTVTFPRAGAGAHILVVEDEEPIRRSLARLLEGAGYACATAANAAEAREHLANGTFALMLCDVTMPGESGFTLLSHVNEAHPDVAVIMVTAVDSPYVPEPASTLGTYGYILKPFDTNVILINVVGALLQRAQKLAARSTDSQSQSDISSHLAQLGEIIDRLHHEDRAHLGSREGTARQAALVAEWRDPQTDSHLHRLSTHAARLAFLTGMAPAAVEVLRIASQLHDIGKVSIPEAILLKTRLLTEEERLIMQGHTEAGFKMLEGFESPVCRLGSIVALSHHERFDGNGYPHGLVGDAIPLEGRIVAIADVYDALRNTRPYKRAYSQTESLEILRHRRRAQLDPELLDLFITDLEKAPKSQ
jgi:putative two-component system response regulator